MRRINFVLVLCALAMLVLFSFYFNTATAVHEQTPQEAPKEVVPHDKPVEEIVKYLAPQNKLTLFPCSDCHDKDWETNSQRRELAEPHDQTPGEFVNHDSNNRWCLDCHSTGNRDKLRLINGILVDFKEYYRICEQCHRRTYREWKMGVHGKRTGYWNGLKEYFHCTQCHNPHNPPFKTVEPMPPPRTPKEIRVIITTESDNTESSSSH